MILVLPVPPSVNGLYSNARRGRVKTEAYLAWIAEADGYFIQQKRAVNPVTGKYRLQIRVPEKVKGDIDNRIKIVSDYLVSREVTPDDQHCQFVSIERADVQDCEVEIVPLRTASLSESKESARDPTRTG